MTQTKCIFNSITERDMDVLFAQLFSIDKGFIQIFIDKLKEKPNSYDVVNVVLSQTDSMLGESDITVVLEADGKRIGLLIEDKIDAQAQKEQCERYFQRGEIGVKRGDYDLFEVFIVCPQKYHQANTTAAKYPNVVTYEEIIDYLSVKEDAISSIWIQELEQAINKASCPSQTIINEKAVNFFIKYRDYIENNAPKLDIRTNKGANGYWANYGTRLGNNVYIAHKIQDGEVNLYFCNAAGHMSDLEQLADWLEKNGVFGVSIRRAGKAGALHLTVPKMNMEEPFEDVSEEDMKKCIDAITKFTEVANMVALSHSLSKLR